MKFMELAKERYSVRKYSDRPLEKEKLDQVLEAGRIAPTLRLPMKTPRASTRL